LKLNPEKVVITAAGLGTRLLPISKELPKEMLPILVGSINGLALKPLLQALFEQLYLFGFREFCFVVGRGKRSIEDHFTPDWGFVKTLKDRGKSSLTRDLESFYRMIEDSKILFVNQPEPRGFGHAVLMAKPFIGEGPFMVCAGDTYIVSRDNGFLRRICEAFSQDAAAVLLLQEIQDPRQYGVAVAEQRGNDEFDVLRVVEKPERPPSKLAIMPFYIFTPEIIEILEDLGPGVGGEIQLTDAIQKLIDKGRRIVGVQLEDDELRLDIGTPETYWEAVKTSYEYFGRMKNE
jgi:UTP--glucose-1-phosphate uridylyltransferase